MYMTYQQAAEVANVSVKTIYYHTNISRKLPIVIHNGKRTLTRQHLERLYPAAAAGVKQHLTGLRYPQEQSFTDTIQQIHQLREQLNRISKKLETLI